MLKVVVPENNFSEREYIIGVLIRDFLGLPYIIEPRKDACDYLIQFSGNTLIVRDAFFNLYPTPKSYLNINSLPKSISYSKNGYTVERDIPVIYGRDEITFCNRTAVCDIDIFASCFFMLTRWEEYVKKSRDVHSRFPGNESIAYVYKFLSRPVVNEYVELLWALIRKLNYTGSRKQRSHELILTHDIDHLDYPKAWKIIIGDLIKRRDLNTSIKNLVYTLKIKKNPYDTCDFLMKLSERLGLKSHFYFMSVNYKEAPDTTPYLGTQRFRNKLRDIIRRGHLIGFHPGYYTYDNPEKWKLQKHNLENVIGFEVTEGRQHYLRFNIPETFRIWNENNMKIDSTLGYDNIEGFRCGTGDAFVVYDFIERRKLKLKERPLIIMDGTLRRNYDHNEAIEIIRKYIAIGQKYRSTITFLFHNSAFYGENWSGYKDIYIRGLGL